MESMDSPSLSLKRKPAPVDSEFLQDSKGKFEESEEFFTPKEHSEASPKTQCSDKDEKKEEVSEDSTEKYSDDRKTEELVSQEKIETEGKIEEKVETEEGEGVKNVINGDKEGDELVGCKENENCREDRAGEEGDLKVNQVREDGKGCESNQLAGDETSCKEKQLVEDESAKAVKVNDAEGL